MACLSAYFPPLVLGRFETPHMGPPIKHFNLFFSVNWMACLSANFPPLVLGRFETPHMDPPIKHFNLFFSVNWMACLSANFPPLVLGRFETPHMGPPGLPIKHAALGFTLHMKDKLLLQALRRMSEIFVTTQAFHSLGWFLFNGYYRNPVEFYFLKIFW